MKKTVLFLLSICILTSSISIPAMAEDNNTDVVVEDTVIPIDDGIEEDLVSESMIIDEFDFTSSNLPRYMPEFSFFSSRYSHEEKAAKLRDYLAERLLNMEQYQDELSLGKMMWNDGLGDVLYFDMSNFSEFALLVDSGNHNSTVDIVRDAFDDIRKKFPKSFWIDDQICWKYDRNHKITHVGFGFNPNINFNTDDGLQPVIDEVNSLITEFDGYVQDIVELIPNDYSDYEKILFVNDYLCTNYQYDKSYSIYDAYHFFKEGTGVCQAYALTFMAIMDEVGIRCDYISSNEMKHGWNLVELNDKWYHIDVTWNDPTFQTTDTLGNAGHKYFLLSSERIENIDAYPYNHYGFDVDNYGYEFGTEYDELEVNLGQSLKSSFIELDGKWYNTGYDERKKTCGLYAFDTPNLAEITNSDLTSPVYDLGRWTTQGNGYYIGCYSYLSKYQDMILFNTPTSICMSDGNNVAELYIPKKADDERIYGFTVKNNTLYMQLATDLNDGMTNATLQTANLVNVVYKDYDGTILSEGFAVEGEKIPDLFLPEPQSIWYTDKECTAGNEYDFNAPVTEPLVLYRKPLEHNVAITYYDTASKQATIHTLKDTDATLFFASYDKDDRLIDCKFMSDSKSIKLTAGTHRYKAPDSFNTEGAKTIKIMLFDRLTSLKPLCETLVQVIE